MVTKNKHRIIAALDTGDLNVALATVRELRDYCGAFKIGHGLTLPYGLAVIDQLREAGAERIFLDLKFHDIPNSVAVAVREACRYGVWMMTLHLSGGSAMLSAAVEEASMLSPESRPLLVGVSVLTSLDQTDLTETLGVGRSIEEHMVRLSQEGMQAGLDGVVCSVQEAKAMRAAIGNGVIVTPGIRTASGDLHDQNRVGDGADALGAGADYLVIGRSLVGARDPERALADLRLG
jgi:orotidine-5'-phosphate decarboxylase